MSQQASHRPYRKVLRMVAELHVRGYQRLRVVPGVSSSGMHWRCGITPAENILPNNGVMPRLWREDILIQYTSGMERQYFGWIDAAHAAPSRMAELFIARFPEVSRAGYGVDWCYAGWYLDMLHRTYPDALPVAYSEYFMAEEYLRASRNGAEIKIPMPPCVA